MRPMRVDTRRFPMVLAVMDGKQSDDDLEHYLDQLAALNERGERFGLVTDIRDYAANFSHATRFGKWSAANEKRTGELCVGAAAVIPSDLIRFLFSSFYLVAQVPFPFITCRSFGEAEAWVGDRLRAAGLAVPPAPTDWGAGPSGA